MQAAIFSRTYAAKGEAVFAAIKADGFSATQLNLLSLGLESLPAALLEDVVLNAKAAALRHGVALVALSGTYNMAHPDLEYRKAQRAKFANVMKAATLMDISVVTLCTGSRDANNMWAYHAENSSPKAWRDFRVELDAVLAIAGELTLAIEPEPGNVICDAKAARALLDDVGSPHLKIILDAANLLTSETLQFQHQIMADAFNLLGGDLVLAHAKDIDASCKVVAPGRGAVDLVAFMNGLKKVGFKGAVVAHGFAENDAASAEKYLTQVLSLQI